MQNIKCALDLKQRKRRIHELITHQFSSSLWLFLMDMFMGKVDFI